VKDPRLLLAHLAASYVLSLPAQAFWFTTVGGIAGAWGGLQLAHLVEQANAAQDVQVAALATPTAFSLPIAVAEASQLYTSTPTPTRTPVPTQTPRPQPDRYPAVSPFVFVSRQ